MSPALCAVGLVGGSTDDSARLAWDPAGLVFAPGLLAGNFYRHGLTAIYEAN